MPDIIEAQAAEEPEGVTVIFEFSHGGSPGGGGGGFSGSGAGEAAAGPIGGPDSSSGGSGSDGSGAGDGTLGGTTSPDGHTFKTDVDQSTGKTVTVERDGNGDVVCTTTTTLDGNRTEEYPPDSDGSVLRVTTGRETDPNGVTSTFEGHLVTKADGSTVFHRVEEADDGSTTQVEAVTDVDGNHSYTMRINRPDGSTVITTRTSDTNQHGTEHNTVFDPDGEVTSDSVIDF